MEQTPDNITNKPQQYMKWFSKAAVFVVALILTTAIIMQGNFLEGLLKLLNVGASRLEQISITSVDDFFGRGSSEWLASFELGANQPSFGDTAAFTTYGGQPNDPGAVTGFLMPLWAGGDPSTLVENSLPYISPVIDVGGEAGEVLHSFKVLDYQPEGAEIIYAYRMASTLPQLESAHYQTLEMADIERIENYRSRQALLGIGLERYIQFKVSFKNFLAFDRPTVAEVNIVYGPASEVEINADTNSTMLPDVSTAPPTIRGDLNNDGVINSLDHAEFLRLWEIFQSEDTVELAN